MSSENLSEAPTTTRAWNNGYNAAESGEERSAPYTDPKLVEAWAAGYDAYDEGDDFKS